MTIEKLNELIENAEKKIEKKKATIEKKDKQIKKKFDLLEKNGFSYDIDMQVLWEKDRDLYWKVWDIDALNEDGVRLQREIRELESKVKSYKEALDSEKNDIKFLNGRPKILNDLEEELYKEFYNRDSEYTDHLKNALNRLGYKDFCRLYKGQYSLTTRTDDDIKKEARSNAKYFTDDIYRRVYKEIGEIVDYSGVSVMGHALNGVFIGKEGKCSVETIEAGGYNIQKLHLRAIIHKM